MTPYDWAPLRQTLVDGDADAARDAVRAALEAGQPPLDIINLGCQPGMDEVGRLFYEGEAYLPDLILAGRAMSAAMEILLPALQASGGSAFQGGRVILGTVQGDLHDIGKNLVGTLIAVAGFQVTDLGIDVPVKQLLEAAVEANARIIGTSSLLTTSNFYQKELIERAVKQGVRGRFYFIVGGSSVTPDYARQIGADGWARTAVGAAELCKRLTQDSPPPPLPAPLVVDR